MYTKHFESNSNVLFLSIKIQHMLSNQRLHPRKFRKKCLFEIFTLSMFSPTSHYFCYTKQSSYAILIGTCSSTFKLYTACIRIHNAMFDGNVYAWSQICRLYQPILFWKHAYYMPDRAATAKNQSLGLYKKSMTV